ncbi:MAG TPA: peptidoglycan bridge formation glycyltransferase FemA/FemB family protein [Clostridia bacterium]|nr:peptidoglycan bridge formation glycyltransferase FemA/FemB family protein [Clostridia bacterium]
MSYQARLITTGERAHFNNFLAGHPQGHVLQSFEWGEVKSLTNWQPLRLMVEEGGRPVAALSILKRPIPGIGKAIFYAPRGPVADLFNHQLLDFLWQKVRELGREHGAILFKMDPDVPYQDEGLRLYLTKAGFQPARTAEGFDGTQPRFVFRLDITPPEEELLANMHHKTRYNIRLASRRGVTVRITKNKDDLKIFYSILQETAERDEFLIRSYEYFSTIWDQLVENGLAEFFLAEYEGEVIAGTLALVMGKKAWYSYGASSNRHRQVMPNYLLQWEMIRWAKNLGCTLYDFRGVPGQLTEDNPLYGLYRFKKGFNGEYVEFVGEYDLILSPFYYRLWQVAEPLYYKGIRQLLNLRRR